MPLVEIQSSINGKILFSLETSSIKLCLEAAVRQKADLSGADLSEADLSGANLRGANLSGADLSEADLTPVRDDLWAVLSAAPKEAAGLRDALISGRVDGSQYDGDCACLVGTIAIVRGCSYASLEKLKPNSNRPSERFFLSIRPGDRPENSQFAGLAVIWIDEWLANMRGAFSTESSAVL